MSPEQWAAYYYAMPQNQQQKYATLTPAQQIQFREYAFSANFSTLSGRFSGAQVTAGSGTSATPGVSSFDAFRARGIPSDPAGRQLAHYFDIDAWQDQKRKEHELKGKPKKIKNWRELKEAKKIRKHRNYVKNLMKD